MKKILLLFSSLLFSLVLSAQNRAPEDVVVIDNQPAGELRMYNRSGMVVREVDREPADEDNPYEIIRERQTGTINMVFANDGTVYMQHPVSFLTTYDGWIKGTLSSDGKTITVPMMQYIAYTWSLDMAVQIAMFKYDSVNDTFVYDSSVSEITYTINDDGSIKQNGTSRNLVLGCMNRAFGDTFKYLDYEWLQSGDYESVYTPFEEETLTPPSSLTTEDYYLTTAEFDGAEWKGYSSTVHLGFDGTDAWLQGLCKYLPNSWIKGTRNGDTITLPTTQFLGTYEVPLYFKGARIENGKADEADIVLTLKDNDWVTTDFAYITTDKATYTYVNYYMGMTLSKDSEVALTSDDENYGSNYAFRYRSNIGEDGEIINGTSMVQIKFQGDKLYIKGLWELLPNSCIEGTISGNQVIFDMPQYLGMYTEEYLGTYPIYLTAFDSSAEVLKEQAIFDYDAATKTFKNSNYPLSIGINKTGYLGVQDFYDCEFLTEEMSIESLPSASSVIQTVYDMSGRTLSTMQRGINIVRMSDGSVKKVLK